jgi:hypothetical protein
MNQANKMVQSPSIFYQNLCSGSTEANIVGRFFPTQFPVVVVDALLM